MTLTIDEFAARLSNAGALVERYSDPILTGFGEIVASEIEANAPKRTRREPGGGMSQTSPGVIELTDRYLVGELRGSARRSPKSRSFLKDSFTDISGPLAAEVASVALSALTGARPSTRRSR